jgi:hypothetical protein
MNVLLGVTKCRNLVVNEIGGCDESAFCGDE